MTYSGKDGFVYKDGKSTRENSTPRYTTYSNNPILLFARCTKVTLEKKILNNPTSIWEHWELTNIQWVNVVPGCGKSTWVNNFVPDSDIIATTTTEAADQE